ncbi:MAG: PHP domain-containing protein, partial [Oscillospiraceae bacterium]|nr:PHP domain-containing protein [Oscillospiraceae bacterium]
MEFKKQVDTHVHTDNSPDGRHSPMYMCETAVDMGLRAVAFTDHCEMESYCGDRYDRSVKQSYFETAKAKSAFLGKLLVLHGIEMANVYADEACGKNY